MNCGVRQFHFRLDCTVTGLTYIVMYCNNSDTLEWLHITFEGWPASAGDVQLNALHKEAKHWGHW